MKYVKSYNDIINENIKISLYDTIKEIKIKLKSLINLIFSIFQTDSDIEKIFIDFNKEIPFNIYDFLNDIMDIISLKEKDIKIYARNLNIDYDNNVIFNIIKKSYENKYKTNLLDDINKCIKHLKQNSDNLSKIYIDNMQQLLDILKNK